MNATGQINGYRADIDGMRAIAVIMVLAYHLKLPFSGGGFLGVDVFFVLSGYLITRILDPGGGGRVSLWAFWLRRVKRLLPLVLVVGLLSALAGWFILLPHQLKDFGQSLGAAPLFATNWLFWHEAGYFTPQSGTKPLLHLWSLGVEAQFYILFPILLVALAPRWHRLAILALGLASLVAGLWVARLAPDSAFFLFPFRFWEFAAGALVALRVIPLRSTACGVFGLASLLAAGLLSAPTDPHPGLGAMLAVAGTVLLLCGAGAVRRGLAHPALVWLGQRSFGIYLWHFPLIVFGGILWPQAGVWAGAAVIISASVVLAALTLPLIERPFRRAGAWRGAALTAATAGAIGLGAFLHLGDGARWRLPDLANQPLAGWQRWDMPCHGVLHAADVRSGARCAIGAPDAAPHIALIGDSHAGQLTPALGPALARRGAGALVFSRGWCAPIPGFATTAPSRGPECGDFIRAAWAEILADERITTVVLAAQWGNFTEGRRAGLNAVRYADAPSVQANAQTFARHVAAFADRLTGRALHIIVVDPVPEYARVVPDTLARKAWASGTLPERLLPVDYDQRNGAVLETLGTFASALGASRVKARALFCGDTPDCRVMSAASVPYYRDASHLSTAGAEVVVARLMPLLNTGPNQRGGTHDDTSQRHTANPDRGG